VNSIGGNPRELRYYPWGGVRYAYGTTPTDYRFTGQQEVSYINLYWYNSRLYDPALGRWIQPDSIIPDPNNPLDWDRYSYVRNSPIKYTDPSGHLSDNQIERWTGLKIDDIDDELLKMLQAARFGDALYGYNANGELTPYGILSLDDSGHLAFGTTSTYSLLNSGMAGWMLSRRIGDTSYLVYHTGGYEHPSDTGIDGLYSLGEGTEEVTSALGKLIETTVAGLGIGVGVEVLCPQCPKGVALLASGGFSFLYGAVDLVLFSQPGDLSLTYWTLAKTNG